MEYNDLKNKKEILSSIDPVGSLYNYGDDFFIRILTKEGKNIYDSIAASGLLSFIVEENFFPETVLTYVDNLNCYGLLHKKIPYVSYPYEWSFSMLKDAALFVLELEKSINRFGFTLKDPHSYNVVFNGTQPTYVDWGSFMKQVSSNDHSCNICKNDSFRKYFTLPLRLWHSKNIYLASIILTESFDRLAIPSQFPIENDNTRIKYISYFNGKNNVKLLDIPQKNIANFLANTIMLISNKILKLLFSNKYLHLDYRDFESIEQLISFIKDTHLNNLKTQWGEYHTEYFKKGAITNITYRFEKIVNIAKSLNIKTVTDLASNQGVISMMLLEEVNLEHVVCIDYDPICIDYLYNRARRIDSMKGRLTTVLLNFMRPIMTSFTYAPDERFKSDLVLALAVSHHLILAQGFQISDILKNIRNYCNRYLIIEFMPKGLWCEGTEVSIPEWYTIDWFKKHLTELFNIIYEEIVEENRHLFLCIIK